MRLDFMTDSHHLTNENIAARIAFCLSAGVDPLILNEWRIGDIDWRTHCLIEAIYLGELQRLRALESAIIAAIRSVELPAPTVHT
jgi:hypothetical protein